MDNKTELTKRKRIRLKNYDYSSTGAYFITICTAGRRRILSEILPRMDLMGYQRSIEPTVGADVLDGPQMKLLKHGEIAEKYIKQMNDFYDNISVDHYVIMPDHIHMIIFVKNIGSILNNLEINETGPSGTSAPTKPKQHSTVSQFISTFKRFCIKEYGENIWQRSFYDHVIRNQHDYDQILKYIYENPINWEFEKFYEQ